MSHKSGTVIINRVAADRAVDVVESASVHLRFPEGTTLEEKLNKIRQVERLLDKLDHDED
jgi:hypothetical protein